MTNTFADIDEIRTEELFTELKTFEEIDPEILNGVLTSLCLAPLYIQAAKKQLAEA